MENLHLSFFNCPLTYNRRINIVFSPIDSISVVTMEIMNNQLKGKRFFEHLLIN